MARPWQGGATPSLSGDWGHSAAIALVGGLAAGAVVVNVAAAVRGRRHRRHDPLHPAGQ
ncbi:hypothetical protein QLQ12_20115 [Actinoplanes sp. NEAU-A12]|uniref:Uncharacterized protein n=1 Tax=Actinoplanes sandaracinus TaxID=3045177 RepID=A0ABT6WMI3_9ACTN|nr:hypothetical protein [Actinoplanes sandaracinus]MDI6100923.1 hypothetical protein [Actinoplanes sandaracinus]